MKLRVAGAQMAVTTDVRKNTEAILRAVAFAAERKADILLTPEGSLSGYRLDFDRARVAAALEEVTAAAKKARVALALGTCFEEPDDGRCYNQIRFYDAHGRHLGFHSKALLCSSLAGPPTGEIEHYATRPLRTFEICGVTVGGLICNDLWANPGCTSMPDPHLTQQLSGAEARVIFHAVNGGRSGDLPRVAWEYHNANLQMRAEAGKIWIVTVDNCFPTNVACSAPSGVIRPGGAWACRTEPKGEQFFVHAIELDP